MRCSAQALILLLGALLLSRDALTAVAETGIGASDFYKPAHGHVFDAVCSLYAQGEPSDPVTVAAALRRAPASRPSTPSRLHRLTATTRRCVHRAGYRPWRARECNRIRC